MLVPPLQIVNWIKLCNSLNQKTSEKSHNILKVKLQIVWNQSKARKLQRLTLARLLTFNKRHPKEMSKLLCHSCPLLKPVDFCKGKRYKISQDELKRRMGAPEFYSASNLKDYLHLGWNPTANKMLNALGDEEIPKTNRYKTPRSPYLRLCEEECSNLTDSVQLMNVQHFPVHTAAMNLAYIPRPEGDVKALMS